MHLETLATPEEIIRRVSKLATDADDIVIDGPAGLSETTRAIMVRADKVFLPCGPSILDLRAASKAVQLLHEAQKVRKGLPKGYLIPNKLQKRVRLSHEMLGAVHELEIPVLPGLSLRQAFADAAGQAKTVSDMSCRLSRQLRNEATLEGDDPWLNDVPLMMRSRRKSRPF